MSRTGLVRINGDRISGLVITPIYIPFITRLVNVPLEVIGSMVIGSMGYFTDPYKWGILGGILGA